MRTLMFSVVSKLLKYRLIEILSPSDIIHIIPAFSQLKTNSKFRRSTKYIIGCFKFRHFRLPSCKPLRCCIPKIHCACRRATRLKSLAFLTHMLFFSSNYESMYVLIQSIFISGTEPIEQWQHKNSKIVIKKTMTKK